MALIILAFIIRIALLPIQIFQSSQQKRLRKIQPQIDHLTQSQKDDPVRLLKEVGKIKANAGIKTWFTLALAAIQIPLFLGIYRVVAGNPLFSQVPFGWISSLAMSDPYFILPLILALLTYLQLRLQAPQKVILRVIPVLNFAFMATLPAALVLYYAASGVFQYVVEASLHKLP